MSPPVGPTGLPLDCAGDDDDRAWTLGGAVSGFSTDLNFDGGDVAVREFGAIATVGRRLGPTLSATLGVGAILGGEIDTGATGTVDPGPQGMVAVSWLAVLERERRPFVQLSSALSGSTAQAESDDGNRHRLTAFDLRVGAMVGKTFGVLVPYVQARGFEGPVSFHLRGDDRVAGDAHHYTVGGGLILRIGRHGSAFAEAMPLGEQSAAAGLSFER